MDRKLFVFTVLVSGCTFKVGGVPLDGPMGDVDQAAVTDFAEEVADMSVPPDFTGLDLLGVDFAPPPPDLTPPPDLAGAAFTPSHVGATYFDPAASDLLNVVEIDTGALTLRLMGGALGPPPSGVKLQKHPTQPWAILTVGAFTVNQSITVRGANTLVVVASKAITVNNVIDAAARLDVAGPGGTLAAMGSGAGTSGTGFSMSLQDTGGGGGGFGTSGGLGGAPTGRGSPLGGAAYGSAISQFSGGSGGGHGGEQSSCSAPLGRGGGGGGGVQLSSAIGITVGPSGVIDVGGGGGRGGCDREPDGILLASGGGGGGSGGEIFLEAPAIAHAGILAANGGGGGAGATYNDKNGENGGNGARAAAAAPGGPLSGNQGGNGGNGGFGITDPTAGGEPSHDNCGGGGGGYGRIWFRTKNTDPMLTGTYVITPAALTDKTL